MHLVDCVHQGRLRSHGLAHSPHQLANRAGAPGIWRAGRESVSTALAQATESIGSLGNAKHRSPRPRLEALMTTAVVISGCIVAIPLMMLAMVVADEFLSRVAQLMLIVCAYLLLPLYALWILGGACMDKLERRRRGHMQRGRQIR